MADASQGTWFNPRFDGTMGASTPSTAAARLALQALAAQPITIVTPPPGPIAQEMIARAKPHLSPSLIHCYPLMVRRASGCMVEDVVAVRAPCDRLPDWREVEMGDPEVSEIWQPGFNIRKALVAVELKAVRRGNGFSQSGAPLG